LIVLPALPMRPVEQHAAKRPPDCFRLDPVIVTNSGPAQQKGQVARKPPALALRQRGMRRVTSAAAQRLRSGLKGNLLAFGAAIPPWEGRVPRGGVGAGERQRGGPPGPTARTPRPRRAP